MHHIIILNIFKNAYINIFFARNHRLFFSLFIYFYAIILNKYYTHDQYSHIDDLDTGV